MGLFRVIFQHTWFDCQRLDPPCFGGQEIQLRGFLCLTVRTFCSAKITTSMCLSPLHRTSWQSTTPSGTLWWTMPATPTKLGWRIPKWVGLKIGDPWVHQYFPSMEKIWHHGHHGQLIFLRKIIPYCPLSLSDFPLFPRYPSITPMEKWSHTPTVEKHDKDCASDAATWHSVWSHAKCSAQKTSQMRFSENAGKSFKSI